MSRIAKSIAGLAAAAIFLTGCSTADTTSTQKILHFNGGIGASQTFEGCVNPSTKEYNRMGAQHFTYQMDLRSYDATGGPASEADPIEVLDKNGETLRVPLTVTFYLKSDCKTLRNFHDTVGDKYNAYNNDKGEPGRGWLNLLNFSIGEPIEVQAELIAKRYVREELRGSEEVRATLEEALNNELPDLVKEKTGGTQFFERFDVSVKQPETTNQALIASIAEAAAAREQAKTVGIKAAADGAAAEAKAQAEGKARVAEANARAAAANAAAVAAEAEVRVARAEAAKQAAAIAGVGGVEAATKRYMADKGLNADQPTVIYGVPQTAGPAQ